MPHLKIITNVPKEKVPVDFVKNLCKLVSTTMGKPLEAICVTLIPDQMQSFGATDDAVAQMTLMSVGGLGIKENLVLSKVLFEAANKGLGVGLNRVCIQFQDTRAQDVGFNGTTVYEMNGGSN